MYKRNYQQRKRHTQLDFQYYHHVVETQMLLQIV